MRAGSHANTLMKTASPKLRDAALLVERQCAQHADLTLAIRDAKDPHKYWLKADEPLRDVDATSFLLADLPDDWRVTIDSHSSSPIFSDENTQLVAAATKMGITDGEYFIDNTPLPNKEAAKTGYRERQKAKAAEMEKLRQTMPEAAEKVAVKQLSGGKH